MKEYQEALNELTGWAITGFSTDIEIIKALTHYNSLIQELVDRATPFKPLNQEIEGINFVLYGQCKCGCEVWEGWKFCVDCGKALDWSNDED